MPELSRFFGIVVRIHFEDHVPPHFHAIYGEFEAEIGIDRPQLLNGSLPPRGLGMAMEWAALHHDDLRIAWDLARSGRPVIRIEPLR
ncbi:MAG: DUF4160 domain-containing protein [Chloroflexi bacterium]|nr:DUF4160 domain-containing protein [Chloroflexota bacterium]